MGAKKIRDMSVLQHKINMLTEKINKMRQFGISEKKISLLELKKDKVKNKLDEIITQDY